MPGLFSFDELTVLTRNIEKLKADVVTNSKAYPNIRSYIWDMHCLLTDAIKADWQELFEYALSNITKYDDFMAWATLQNILIHVVAL